MKFKCKITLQTVILSMFSRAGAAVLILLWQQRNVGDQQLFGVRVETSIRVLATQNARKVPAPQLPKLAP